MLPNGALIKLVGRSVVGVVGCVHGTCFVRMLILLFVKLFVYLSFLIDISKISFSRTL